MGWWPGAGGDGREGPVARVGSVCGWRSAGGGRLGVGGSWGGQWSFWQSIHGGVGGGDGRGTHGS